MTPSEKLVLRAVTFEAPYLIQICRHDGEVVTTVGDSVAFNTNPVSPPPTQFNLWIGYGCDEHGVPADPDLIVMVGKLPVEMAWTNAVGLAYQMAYGLLINAPDAAEILKYARKGKKTSTRR
jgi:hypothetical protein